MGSLLPLRANLYLFTQVCRWYTCPNVDLRHIILRMVESILRAARAQSKVLQYKALETIMDAILDWASSMDSAEALLDPVIIRTRIQAALEGLQRCTPTLTEGQRGILIERTARFLDGSAFDIRILLADAPPDFGLEDVVREHFKPTSAVLSILQSLDLDGSDASRPRLGEICEDYFKNLVAHLIKSVSYEPFLCSLVDTLSVGPHQSMAQGSRPTNDPSRPVTRPSMYTWVASTMIPSRSSRPSSRPPTLSVRPILPGYSSQSSLPSSPWPQSTAASDGYIIPNHHNVRRVGIPKRRTDLWE